MEKIIKKIIAWTGVLGAICFFLWKWGDKALENGAQWFSSSETSSISNTAIEAEAPANQSKVILPGAPPTVFKLPKHGILKTRIEPGKQVKICFRNKNGVLVAPSGQLAIMNRFETWGTGIWNQELPCAIDYDDVTEIIVYVPAKWPRTYEAFLGTREYEVPGVPTTYTVWKN